MKDINVVTLGGRLCDVPELRYTGGGVPVAKFAVAVNETFLKEGKENTIQTFVDCTAFYHVAEHCSKLSKGQAVLVVGRLRKDVWEDKVTKAKRYKLYVVADGITATYSDKPQQTELKPTPAPVTEERQDDDVPF